jgi:hypothetical protein
MVIVGGRSTRSLDGMRDELAEFTVSIEGIDTQALLSSWPDAPTVARSILMTVFGDLFFADPSGAVYFVDLTCGEITKVAETEAAFDQIINSNEIPAEWFMPDIADTLRDAGLVLSPGQCFGYKQPPVLGGAVDAANLEITDIEVYYSLMGQIVEQIKGLPPGTIVDGLTLE